MGSNRKLLFGVLLVIGAVVFWGLLRAVNNANRVAQAPTPVPSNVRTVSLNNRRLIARAITAIPQGSIVTKEMFEMVPLPGSGLTSGFVTNPEAQAIGYITRVPLSKGDQIRPDEDFVGHISEVGIAGALRPGTRAIVVPFANKPTLHDLVRIGNFVDINAAFDGQEARTIVPAVRVLAVDVFGNDFPQVSVAIRGPYKAEPKGGGIGYVPANPAGTVDTAGNPVAPNATPTPTPAPAQAPARPDPAVTFEVTPAQANSILLAQASGAVIDFVVLPALPGNRPLVPGVVPGEDGVTTAEGETAQVRSVSITKAQLAPYAERKKAAGGSSATTRTASTGGGGSGGSGGRVRETFNPPPSLPVPTGGGGMQPMPMPNGSEPAPPSPTYDIPIYADGKTVRIETVRRPQD